MSTPVISVEHLSKAYRLGHKEEIPDTFVGAATSWLKAPLRNWRRLRRLNTFNEPVVSQLSVAEEDQPSSNDNGPSKTDNGQPDDILWALRDVSFEVGEGEVVGIIGRNGAGKSTLLKILSRITEPTHGRAVIRGRVSSLLEVGTGFHPELTGRENIYMNGTILGMRKREIDKKFDEIVDFSGVEKFLDTPIKRYSSGMQVRLAFAVAAHLEPEILIIDEVLAVGDAEFQKKCLGKMQDVAKGGRTVLFVSHNMAAIDSLCSSGLWFKDGKLRSSGEINAITHDYVNDNSRDHQHGIAKRTVKGKVCWIESAVPVSPAFKCGTPIAIDVRIVGDRSPFRNAWVSAYVSNDFGLELIQCDSRLVPMTFDSEDLPLNARLLVRTPWLKPGRYLLNVHIVANGELDALEGQCYFDIQAPFPYPVVESSNATHRGAVCPDFSWVTT